MVLFIRMVKPAHMSWSCRSFKWYLSCDGAWLVTKCWIITTCSWTAEEGRSGRNALSVDFYYANCSQLLPVLVQQHVVMSLYHIISITTCTIIKLPTSYLVLSSLALPDRFLPSYKNGGEEAVWQRSTTYFQECIMNKNGRGIMRWPLHRILYSCDYNFVQQSSLPIELTTWASR